MAIMAMARSKTDYDTKPSVQTKPGITKIEATVQCACATVMWFHAWFNQIAFISVRVVTISVTSTVVYTHGHCCTIRVSEGKRQKLLFMPRRRVQLRSSCTAAGPGAGYGWAGAWYGKLGRKLTNPRLRGTADSKNSTLGTKNECITVKYPL